MEFRGCRTGLGEDRIGVFVGYYFFFFFGVVGGEVFGDDVCILEEYVVDGLGRI